MYYVLKYNKYEKFNLKAYSSPKITTSFYSNDGARILKLQENVNIVLIFGNCNNQTITD